MIESITDILNLNLGESNYLVKNESWEVSIKKLKNGKWFEINISQKKEYPVARSGFSIRIKNDIEIINNMIFDNLKIIKEK